MKMARRKFLKRTTSVGAALTLCGFSNTSLGREKMNSKKRKHSYKRCIILGMDGLDPQILTELIKDNKLPNFVRLAEEGTFVLFIEPQQGRKCSLGDLYRSQRLVLGYRRLN